MVDICKHPCPSKVVYGRSFDRLTVQTGLSEAVDLSKPFIYVLRNSSGIIAFGEIPSGALVDGRYRNNRARFTGGIATLRILPTRGNMRLVMTAYDNIEDASSDMELSIAIGDDIFTSTSPWEENRHGWTAMNLH